VRSAAQPEPEADSYTTVVRFGLRQTRVGSRRDRRRAAMLNRREPTTALDVTVQAQILNCRTIAGGGTAVGDQSDLAVVCRGWPTT